MSAVQPETWFRALITTTNNNNNNNNNRIYERALKNSVKTSPLVTTTSGGKFHDWIIF
jgi:hypothetical protein